MKLSRLFWGAVAFVTAFTACQEEEKPLGTPDINLSATEMSFESASGEQTLTVTATRDWMVETDADWVVVSPESGEASSEAQTVTVTVLENKGLDRETDVKFTIGMKSRYLTVTQSGPKGSAENLIVYYNDYDKEVAEKTYGSGTSWPYLDQFDGWQNQTGTGAADVTYAYNGMSARANSTSNSSYSDYEGSGNNNMFFGKSAYIATGNIALGGATDLTLTFGTEKYSQDNGSVFKNSEFHVFLSQDGTKWVELTDYTFAGGETEGRWNVAEATFSVPSGTQNLSICMQVDVASSYRMDDMKLVVAESAGTQIDFSNAVEKDFTVSGGNTGGNGGGGSDAAAIYSNNYDKTAAAEGSKGWPYLDQSDAWKNAAGTGAANVTYSFKGVSVRNNANSDGSYSDYAGSGMNNIFFGKTPYFATNNIALGGATNLTLTFGTEKYSQANGSLFKNSEYHIWLSNDGGAKWVEFTDYTYAGGSTEGRWNIATANFSVPAGTSTISICMQVDAESSYRMDDFKLVEASAPGTSVDFSNAVEKDFSAGGSTGGDNPGGGNDNPPVGGAAATIAEVLASSGSLASGTTIEGIVISNRALNNLTSKKGLYVQDATGGLQFYLAANHEFDFGDKVLIDLSGASLAEYNGAVQISGLGVEKISLVSTGNKVTPKTVSITDFLANKYEGQYVAIEGVQVAGADLNKTFVEGDSHTSITVETADGKTFAIFSSQYATYGDTKVPQGSGTIKGISSISKGAMQVIFAQESDFAGLTGTRFDGSVPPSGGDQGGDEDEPTPPAGGDGEYEPNISWTLGNKAYDSTSGSNAQHGVVNGVEVNEMLKLGTSSVVGDATLHVPAGTTKLGFYCVAWKGKKAELKLSAGGKEIDTIDPNANVGATGNPPYTITLSSNDYFEVEMPSTAATDVKVETLDPSNGRVLIIGLKAIAE